MKLKIRALLNKKKSLDKVLNKELPFKTAYRLSKLAQKIDQKIRYVEKEREKLVSKYGEKNEQNDRYNVPNEKMKDFKAAWEKLIDGELTITCEKVPVELLELVVLSAYDVAHLSDFIDDKKQEKVDEK